MGLATELGEGVDSASRCKYHMYSSLAISHVLLLGIFNLKYCNGVYVCIH